MPKDVRQSLLEKGWEEEDIAKAEDILYSKEKQQKHYGYLKSVHPMLYWMGLMLAIIGNMIISVFLIPFFLVMSSTQLLIVIATMGFVFGMMFNFLLRDIEHVDYKHHVVAGVFIPALAVITILVVVRVANTFAKILKSNVHQNMWVVAIVYVIAFTTPYLTYKFNDLKFQKTHKKRVEERVKAAKQPEKPEEKKEEFASNEEAWKIYQQRQKMDKARIQSNLTQKFRKFL